MTSTVSLLRIKKYDPSYIKLTNNKKEKIYRIFCKLQLPIPTKYNALVFLERGGALISRQRNMNLSFNNFFPLILLHLLENVGYSVFVRFQN